MRVELLAESASAALARQEPTYPASVHATDEPPVYGYLTRNRILPRHKTFAQLSDELMSWQFQARSGLRVAASSRRVELDAVVVMRWGLGRVALRIPCRVVAVFDEVDRVGFAYGTLPGHPESGEEAFVLHRRPDGSTELAITACSRPASTLARLGGPVSAQLQRWMTTRYLHALD